MEIVKKIQARAIANARLEDGGEFSISVSCAVEYRPGVSATAMLHESELPREKTEAVRSALKALLAAAQDKAADEAVRHAAEAEQVQKRMELLAG